MKAFEYAAPSTEVELLDLLDVRRGQTELLGGGGDLVGLLKRMVVAPDRLVYLGRMQSMQSVEVDPLTGGLKIGGGVHLDALLDGPALGSYPAVRQAIAGINSMQMQCQGTLAGELFRRPRCWYFRAGHGLLADNGRMVAEGDNRYHAILGNDGPAKFVSASRLAPARISLGAVARVLGPSTADEQFLPLEALYRTPQREGERELTLDARQVVTHLLLPPAPSTSAAYEVRQGCGPDDPLAAAAATLELDAVGVVRGAKVVLGQVAPVPWISNEAVRQLVGRPVSEATAEAAGRAAIAGATPLSENEYKVQLTQVAVRRAILLAAGLKPGGLG